MNEVGEQRGYTDMVTELTQGFTAQPGSIMRDAYGTQVKQRLHAAQGSQEPYYVKLYNSMGATDIARSREIAVLQMSMTPSGIDALKRNAEASMTYIQQQPEGVVFDNDEDGGGVPGNHGGVTAVGDQQHLQQLVNLQNQVGVPQGRSQLKPGEGQDDLTKVLEMEEGTNETVEKMRRQEDQLLSRSAQADELGGLNRQRLNAINIIADPNIRQALRDNPMGEDAYQERYESKDTAKLSTAVGQAVLMRLAQEIHGVSKQAGRQALAASVNPEVKMDQEINSIINKHFRGNDVRERNSGFDQLAPTQKLIERMLLADAFKNDLPKKLKHEEALATAFQTDYKADLQRLSKETGVNYYVLVNLLDEVYDDHKDDQEQLGRAKGKSATQFLIRNSIELGDTKLDMFQYPHHYPLHFMPTGRANLMKADDRTFMEKFQIDTAKPMQILRYMNLTRADKNDVLIDRYGVRNMSKGEYEGLQRAITSLAFDTIHKLPAEEVNKLAQGILHTNAMFSKHSQQPIANKASVSFPTTNNPDMFKYFKKAMEVADEQSRTPKQQLDRDQARGELNTFRASMSIPDYTPLEEQKAQLNGSPLKQRPGFAAGNPREVRPISSLQEYTDLMLSQDTAINRTGLLDLIEYGKPGELHMMFAPKGELQFESMQSTFNDARMNDLFGKDDPDSILAASLQTVIDNRAMNMVNKLKAAEVYERADYALRRLSLSATINSALITTHAQGKATGKFDVDMATDELISAVTGFKHVVDMVRAYDPDLNVRELTQSMYMANDEFNWQPAVSFTAQRALAELKHGLILPNLPLASRLQIPEEADEMFRGVYVASDAGVYKTAMDAQVRGTMIQNLSVVNQFSRKPVGPMRIQTTDDFYTRGVAPRNLRAHVKSKLTGNVI